MTTTTSMVPNAHSALPIVEDVLRDQLISSASTGQQYQQQQQQHSYQFNDNHSHSSQLPHQHQRSSSSSSSQQKRLSSSSETYYHSSSSSTIDPMRQMQQMHYGTKPGHFETSKIHFPTSEWCERTSKRTSEWPSTYVSILVYSRPQCDAVVEPRRSQRQTHRRRRGLHRQSSVPPTGT